MTWLREQTKTFLKQIREAQDLRVYPYFREFESIGPRVYIGGKRHINFTSNDYLGLSQDARLIRAAEEALRRFGTGLGSSRVQATSTRHVELERRLADWFGYPACTVFTTGYQALVGFLSTFLQAETTVILDNLSHASILDGTFLAKGRLGDKLEVRFFKHNSTRGLRRVLENARYANKMIVAEGVYSLDGDIAPLPDFVELARRYNAVLVMDDAHGIGTLGQAGRGIGEHFGLEGIDVLIGTFSKSFGGVGGFVLAERDLIEYMRNSARSFVFSASLPVAQVEAALAALEIMSNDRSYLQRLWANQQMMRQGLDVLGYNVGESNTHITPLIVGEDALAVEFGAWLFGMGIIMLPLIYPAVPKGQARLRCNITAAHSRQEIGLTLEALAFAGKKLGILPSQARTPFRSSEKVRWYAREAQIRLQDTSPRDLWRLGRQQLGGWLAQGEALLSGRPAPLEEEQVMRLKQTFAKKNVLLTGGSSGIGRSLAHQLATLGANLCLVARRSQPLEETIGELEPLRQDSEQRFETLVADISQRKEIEEKLAELVRHFDVDFLINNAGIAHADYLNTTSPEIFEEMICVNYLGTVWVTRALLPHFQKRRRGHIANVSSLAGVLGIFGYAAYAPSKFALVGFSDVLRSELLNDNIGVSILFPPDTDTPQYEAENRTKPPETKAIAGTVNLMHPDDVARDFLQGIAAGQYHIVPGMDAKIPYYSTRLIPRLTRWFIDRPLKKFLAR